MPESNWLEKASKKLVYFSFVVSVVLTVYNWSSMGDIKDRLMRVPVMLVALLVSEAIFIGALAMTVIGAGYSFKGLRGWFSGLRYFRKNLKDLAEQMSGNRLFQLGFNLQFYSAITTFLLLIVGILWIFPPSARGLLAVPIIDTIATCAWRIPAMLKIRALKEAS